MHHPQDLVQREELIRQYLLRRLDPAATEDFESHYLACEDCFEEMRAAQLLMAGLANSAVDVRRQQDVLVLEFSAPVQLTRQARQLTEFLRGVLEQKDTKVLIDLSRVSRIDSAGLGLLMNWYSHAIRNQGALKLLNPNTEVQKVLHVTRMDTVVETYFDRTEALASFRQDA
jgi:anti-sigma B factor antagonist